MALTSEDIQNLWSNDFVQKNPKKSYAAYYPNEYSVVQAYLAGGPEPTAASLTSKLGKGLVAAERERRADAADVPPAGSADTQAVTVQ